MQKVNKPNLSETPLAQVVSILGTPVFTILSHLKGKCPYDGSDSNSPINYNLESYQHGLFHHHSSGRKWIPWFPPMGGQQWLSLKRVPGWAPAALGVQSSLELFKPPQSLFKITFWEVSQYLTSVAFLNWAKGWEMPLRLPCGKEGTSSFFLTVKGLPASHKQTHIVTHSFHFPSREKDV